VRRAKAFEGLDLAWLEEPLPAEDVSGHQQLREHTSIPVAVGESMYHLSQFREYLELGACTIVQPDVARIGGITPWIKVAHLAEAFDVPVCPHFLMELHVKPLRGSAQRGMGGIHSPTRRHHHITHQSRQWLCLPTRGTRSWYCMGLACDYKTRFCQTSTSPPKTTYLNMNSIDLLIQNAQVFDGNGNAPQLLDVAIHNGLIHEVGPSLHMEAKQTIDAQGLALMPGIIDSHTHYDAQITWDPFVNPSPALGVTTAIIGNCGFTIAPCKPADREITMRNLTQVEGMSLDVLRQGIDWDFETFPQYLELLKRKGSAVNVAAYIGHSSVRTWVLGDQANKRTATADEIERMAAIVREAMDSGAIGFASSASPAHNGEGGLPMPSRLANDEEMMAMIKAMGEKGKGIYMVTKGGQMPVSFLEDMSAQSGRPVMIAALLHNSTNPDAVFKDLDAITQANARGRESGWTSLMLPTDNGLYISVTLPCRGITKLEASLRPQP
jgi:hypothetical protein